MVLGITEIITNSFGIKEGGMCTEMQSVTDFFSFPLGPITLILKTQTANESEDVYLLLNSRICNLKSTCNKVILKAKMGGNLTSKDK